VAFIDLAIGLAGLSLLGLLAALFGGFVTLMIRD